MKYLKVIQQKFVAIIRILEMFISLLLLIAVILSTASLVFNLMEYGLDFKNADYFSNFITFVFNTIIGIEFLKLLVKHSSAAVIEVLMFSIAKQMITTHTTLLESMFGIIGIALIFIIRKYFFVSTFDEEDDEKNC